MLRNMAFGAIIAGSRGCSMRIEEQNPEPPFLVAWWTKKEGFAGGPSNPPDAHTCAGDRNCSVPFQPAFAVFAGAATATGCVVAAGIGAGPAAGIAAGTGAMPGSPHSA